MNYVTEKNSFNEISFWSSFEKDLASAQARVLIQSPFLSFGRLTKLTRIIEKLVTSRVIVCAFDEGACRRRSLLPSRLIARKKSAQSKSLELFTRGFT